MKAHWMTALFLSAGLVAGCNTQEPQDIEDTTTATEEAVSEDTTTGEEPAASAVPDTSSRTDTTSRADAPRAPQTPRTTPTPRAGAGETTKPAPPAAQEPEYRELRVDTGTALPLELQTALSSETATVEMPVQARLTQAISVSGVTVLPAGTQFNGTVTEVQQAGRVKGRARVSVVFNQAIINGARRELQTEPLTFEAQGTRAEDATKIGVGAGVGAVIGGILGGGSGAAKGAAIGGAAGTGAVLATKGQHVQVAEGTALAATLAEPFTVEVRVQ